MARRQGPARRRRTQTVIVGAPPTPAPPLKGGGSVLESPLPLREGVGGRGAERVTVIATRDDIVKAIAFGATTLVTAPGVAHAAGPAWVAGIVRRLKPANPPTVVYDVGDDAALGHALCVNRQQVIFTGSAKFRAILAATFPGQVWRGIARTGRLR